MKVIDSEFVDRGAAGMTGDNVRSVVDNADAIRARFSRGGPLGRLIEDGELLLALVRDYWTGRYRRAPLWAIGASVFALLYVLAPLDLVPDAIPLIGVVDDAAVVSVCLALLHQELARYASFRAAAEKKSDAS